MTTFIVPYAPHSAADDDRRRLNFQRVNKHLKTFGEPVRVGPIDLSLPPAQGIAKARNWGAHGVKDDVIVFNDADSLVEGFQIIRAASLARQEPGLVFAYTRYLRLTKSSTEAILRDGWHTHLIESDWESRESLSSGCVAISVESFREVGGYDETWLDGFEDYDFALRCNALWPNRRVSGDLLHLWHERPLVEPENGRDVKRWNELYG